MYHPAPMPNCRLVALRDRTARAAAIVILVGAAACSGYPGPSSTPSQSGAAPSERPTPVPTPLPTPTAAPTPRFTNTADPELAALFPAAVAGVPLVVAPVADFALTPGDVGLAYGELGLRFASLAIAYVEQPRLTLYAVRVDGGAVTTEDLEPHLATAGRYVGIAGLARQPWALEAVGGHQVWTRPGDSATAAGTVLYTWAGDGFIFLLIGVDATVNQALVGALPGEDAATPSRTPGAPAGSPSPSAPAG